MPDSDGDFKGITVPPLPWQRGDLLPAVPSRFEGTQIRPTRKEERQIRRYLEMCSSCHRWRRKDGLNAERECPRCVGEQEAAA